MKKTFIHSLKANNNYFKIVCCSFIAVFSLVIIGCGNSENKKIENFCGKTFTMTSRIENIDMTTRGATILNCDGTYNSSEHWETSEQSKEAYINRWGSSSGNFSEFSGTWEVVANKDIPTEVDDYLKSYEGKIGKFYTEKRYVILKYKSNKGKNGYLLLNDDGSNQLYLGHIITSISGVEGTYKDEDLHIFNGFAYK